MHTYAQTFRRMHANTPACARSHIICSYFVPGVQVIIIQKIEIYCCDCSIRFRVLKRLPFLHVCVCVCVCAYIYMNIYIYIWSDDHVGEKLTICRRR